MLGSLGAILAWLVVFGEGLAAAGQTVEWAQFLGRFHPVVLHLPIGLFVALVVIEFLSMRQRSGGVERSALILAWLLALSSSVAAFSGLLLASNGDYSGEIFDWHKWLGVIFAASVLFAVFLKVLSLYSEKGKFYYRLLILVLLVLLPVVGHNGGNLTHGTGYLTEYAPDWLSSFLGDRPSEISGEDLPEGNLFTHEVQPVLEQYCVECHGPDKQKSQYRMDTYEYLLTSGKLGDPTVEPGSMAESMLLQYMLLPETDKMAMPPEGKLRPSAEEILLIAHWIASGAEGPPVDQAALAAQQAATEAERAELEALFGAGVVLLPIGSDSDMLYLDLQNANAALADEVLEVLASYKDRIHELKLSGYADAATLLRAIEGAAQLRHMNLSGLQGADLMIDSVNSFAGLEALNLFGSDLSDGGLSKISLPELRSLYLGSTQVSAAGLAAYAQANTTVEVIGDVDLSSVEAIQEADAANSAEFKPQKK